MPVVFSLRALIAFPLLVTAVACGDTPGDAAGARSTADAPRRTAVHDDFGEPLPLGRTYSRIVSLEPATTEILFALGAGPRLVGRTQYDVFPDSARLIPSLGGGIRPNIESIVAARPDLVVLYASGDNRPTAERLRSVGIATVAFRSDRIASFSRITMALGQLVGDTVRARTVHDSVHRTLDAVRRATAGRPRPTVLMPVWYSPLYVIGGTSFLNELVDIAGGRNVYDAIPAPSPQVTFEDIVRRDPDMILVAPTGRARVLGSDGWRVLRAVREGRVVAYDTLVTGRPGVRLGEAAVSLAALLHPGLSVQPR